MPELKCTVQTCMHNQDYYCTLDKIQVGGNSAKKAEETSCDSFQERGASQIDSAAGSYSNSYSGAAGTGAGKSMGNASACSCVDCQAVQCKYNDSCKCHAGKISVETPGRAVRQRALHLPAETKAFSRSALDKQRKGKGRVSALPFFVAFSEADRYNNL